ncbi:allene oxide cyclase barrel-like domain-containing protein [Streptacidiphilus anmyonensis]|uniref:allene oxide cyclase barrel-like domain-containing protein n=1 Tax=Streptacidiphilus anmyonensis TaxID=405782 RepID=UPI0005AB2BBB|nr:hypothetical protein [Streptacidiphilus anmyonensis]
MTRFVTSKRAALAAAAAGVAALALVAGVSGTASAAHLRAANVPAMTLDFNGSNDEAGAANSVGAGFGGTAAVKDTSGNKIGTAYDMCDKDGINANSVTVFCSGEIVLSNGDQIAVSGVFPIQDPATATYPKSFEGVVTGGTGAYEGMTGTAHFTNRSLGVYDVTFS